MCTSACHASLARLMTSTRCARTTNEYSQQLSLVLAPSTPSQHLSACSPLLRGGAGETVPRPSRLYMYFWRNRRRFASCADDLACIKRKVHDSIQAGVLDSRLAHKTWQLSHSAEVSGQRPPMECMVCS